MSLRDTERVPSRVVGFVHTAMVLAANYGDEPLNKDHFSRLVSPMQGREGTLFGHAFNECVILGLFTPEEGDRFRLEPRFTSLIADRQKHTLSSEKFVREQLIPKLREYILSKLSEPVIEDGNRAFYDVEFSRMLAWVMMQEAESLPLTKISLERLSATQDERKMLGWTQTNHEGFVRWAQFLGFQHMHNLDGKTAYQPDPTPALVLSLDTWLPLSDKNTPTEIDTVLGRLEITFPWLENGEIARQVREGLSSPPSHNDGELSPVLSLALRRLARRGVIKLQHFSDSDLRILTWAGKREAVSRVTRLEGDKTNA